MPSSTPAGPESSGEQEKNADEKSGGAASIDSEKMSEHFTDWDDRTGRTSWDEKGGEVKDLHTTPLDPEPKPDPEEEK